MEVPHANQVPQEVQVRCEFREPSGKAADWIECNVSLVFDDPSDSLCGLRYTNISIRKGDKGLWVAMPARKDTAGKWREFLIPVGKGTSALWNLKRQILAEYEKHLHSEDGIASTVFTPDEDDTTPF
jgi:DNA-binding cell septation regulator SpoVG